MLRFAVCDDERHCLEIMAAAVRETLSACTLQATVSAFESGEELLSIHRREPFDVLVLDIDMPRMSGFDIATAVREQSYQPYVIFVTSEHGLVYDSFEFQPFYFICKRIDGDLKADMAHAVRKLEPLLKQHKALLIADNTLGQMLLPLKDILYIQSDKHYLFYYRTGDPVPLKERASLAYREDLKTYDFLKPHRRFLVNMKHIRRFDLMLHAITMSNGENIPLSKTFKEDAFDMYRRFMRR